MRAITKGAEPPSLTAHRLTPHANYDNYADKNALRNALATEQRGLCCYCTRRIRNDTATMKIEHWHCRSRYPAEELKYRNLLGACRGGIGQPRRLQHCDTLKDDQDLRWNPAEPAHHIETRLLYEADGSIRSNDAGFETELEEVLNLNLPWLKNHRQGVRDGILDWWTQEKARLQGPIPRARLERERDRHTNGGSDLAPFAQVAVWWLEQRLARMPA